jgi:hypothetical protein
VVSTLAGGSCARFEVGVGATVCFHEPVGIIVDAHGSIFVRDSENESVRRLAPDGLVSTVAGGRNWGFADGVGASACFHWPAGLAMDLARDLMLMMMIIIVTDLGNDAIRRVTVA